MSSECEGHMPQDKTTMVLLPARVWKLCCHECGGASVNIKIRKLFHQPSLDVVVSTINHVNYFNLITDLNFIPIKKNCDLDKRKYNNFHFWSLDYVFNKLWINFIKNNYNQIE